MTVQNLPFVDGLLQRADRLGMEHPHYNEQTHYPITLTAQPGPSLTLKLGYDARRFSSSAIERVLEHLQTLLGAIAEDPDRTLADVRSILDRELQAVVDAWGRPEEELSWDIDLRDIDRLGEEDLDVLIDRLG